MRTCWECWGAARSHREWQTKDKKKAVNQQYVRGEKEEAREKWQATEPKIEHEWEAGSQQWIQQLCAPAGAFPLTDCTGPGLLMWLAFGDPLIQLKSLGGRRSASRLWPGVNHSLIEGKWLWFSFLPCLEWPRCQIWPALHSPEHISLTMLTACK